MLDITAWQGTRHSQRFLYPAAIPGSIIVPSLPTDHWRGRITAWIKISGVNSTQNAMILLSHIKFRNGTSLKLSFLLFTCLVNIRAKLCLALAWVQPVWFSLFVEFQSLANLFAYLIMMGGGD